MNYIKHITSFIELSQNDQRLSSYHFSLYIALFYQWNRAFFKNPISILRHETMSLAKIGSNNTYLKCLKELHDWHYIKYEPSNNPQKGSLVYLCTFDTTHGCRSALSGAQLVHPSINKENNNKQEIEEQAQNSKDNLFEMKKSIPLNSSSPNRPATLAIAHHAVLDEYVSSFVDPLNEPKQERNTNRFLLAQDYLNKHFEIRRNIVTQEYECRDLEKDEFLVMNENNIFIRMQVDGLNFSLPNLIALLKSEFIEDYNPFEEYFNNLPPWDGKTDYISFLTSFVHTADRQRFDLHFKKWLVRVVACALVDSVFNKQAFVLVHDKQNSGKSTFCRFLCPPDLQNYIAENLSIDKDSRILLCRNLLINLDELSTLSKIEINSLKSLFSKDKINERLPYDRRNSILPRRCSFIGSTNQVEFLNDETGSVRWLCFVIDEIDWSYAEKVNINMVYAQAYHLFKNGYQYNITQEEVQENEQYNRQFYIVTPESDLIVKYLTPATKANHHHFWTSTDIMLYLSAKTDNNYKLSSVNIGKALKTCDFERVKNHSDKIYGYYIFCNDEPPT